MWLRRGIRFNIRAAWVAASLCARDGLNIGLLHMGHYTTNADSVQSMCYFEELNNIGSFSAVL